MKRLQLCGAGLMLACSAGAMAQVEPYPTAVQGADGSMYTRSQVAAEFLEAQRLGLVVSGEQDIPAATPLQMQMIANAGRHAIGQADETIVAATNDADDTIVVWGNPQLLRAKTSAEAAEANRLGLLSFGEGDPPIATAAQEAQIAAAGRRAVQEARFGGDLARAAGR